MPKESEDEEIGPEQGLFLLRADAEELPFRDQQVDYVSYLQTGRKLCMFLLRNRFNQRHFLAVCPSKARCGGHSDGRRWSIPRMC